VLLIHAKKSSDVELWLDLVQRYQIVLHGLVVLTLLLVDETHIVVDGAGPVFHLGGALYLSECGIVLAGKVESNAQPAVDEEG
jgi:hypothetical protein